MILQSPSLQIKGVDCFEIYSIESVQMQQLVQAV
jgi:hypothetical protein